MPSPTLKVRWSEFVTGLPYPPAFGTRVNLPGDVVNNNASANTLADVTGLSFPVVAGTRYGFSARIRYDAAATTTGSRWTANGPAATLIEIESTWMQSSSTALQRAVGVTWDSGVVSAGSGLTLNMVYINGEVVPSASGTVIIRFSSEVSSSAITAIAAGSWLDWWTI